MTELMDDRVQAIENYILQNIRNRQVEANSQNQAVITQNRRDFANEYSLRLVVMAT
jgi:hypothetical protein